jgi:hypothetical protein
VSDTRSVDERFRDDLEAEYEAILAVVRDALKAKKRVRVHQPCSKCNCQHVRYVEIDNAETAMKAAEFLSNRGIGRPGTVEPGEREVVHNYVLEWVIPCSCGKCECVPPT